MMMDRIRPENRKLRLHLEPSTYFWFVPLIAIVELLLFIVMVIAGIDALNPDPIALFEWGANQRSAVVEGELWRLLTAAFIHHGAFHLCVNLIGFWLAGRILEPLIGWKNMTLLLLFSAVVSGVSSFFWNPYMVSVGASGMVYGMMGSLLVFLFTKSSYLKELVPHLFLLFVLFILQWVFSTFSQHVDHAAHIGGAIAGFLGGIMFSLSSYYPKAATPIRGVMGLFSIGFVLSVLVLGKGLSNPLGVYQKAAKSFHSELFQANKAWLNASDTAAFEQGILHLKKAKEAARKVNRSDMPEALQVRLQQMELYAALKEKQFVYRIDYLKNRAVFSIFLYRDNQEALNLLESEIGQQKRTPQE